jgi:hypothetical protein
MKQKKGKYRSECVLCFHTSFFTQCLPSCTQRRQCWTFVVKPVGVEAFRLRSKLFLRHVWNEILWVVSFWELQITRNQTVPGMVCSSFKCDALYVRWIGSTSMGSEIVVLKNHLFLLDEHDLFVFSASLRSSRKSRGWCSSISLHNFVEHLSLQDIRCVERPSRPRQFVQVQISSTLQQCYYPTTHNTYVHSIFTI